MKRDDLMNEWLAGHISLAFIWRKKESWCGLSERQTDAARVVVDDLIYFVLLQWILIELIWLSGNVFNQILILIFFYFKRNLLKFWKIGNAAHFNI